MATVTITVVAETDTQVEYTCTFNVTSPLLSWVEIVTFPRERLMGLTQAQLKNEVFFPTCEKIINGRIGVNAAQLAGNVALNTPLTVPNTP